MKLLGGVTVLSTLAAPLLWAPPAMAVPTGVSVSDVDAGELSLSVTWAPTGATVAGDHYVVKAHDPAGVQPDRFCTEDIGAADTTCVIKELKAGLTYDVTVELQDVNDTRYGSVATSADTTTERTPIKPGKPTGVTGAATGVSGQMYVSWTAGESADAKLTNYTATAYLGGASTGKTCNSASDTTYNCKINGLTDGTAYTFKVVANGASNTGNSDASDPSGAAAPSVKPAAPTNASAVAADDGATHLIAIVSWDAPADTAGAVIDNYDVTGFTADGTSVPNLKCDNVPAGTTSCDASTANTSWLTASTGYYFKVTATTVGGQTSVAATTPVIIAAAAPDPPGTVSAVAGSGKATVSWLAPASTTNVDSYRVTAVDPDGATNLTCTTTTLTCSVTGLTNGTPYTFDVVSVNETGGGTLSTVTSLATAVTPLQAPVPGKPTAVQLTAGVNQLGVSWTAATTNPAPAMSFTATAAPGGASCSTGDGSTTSCTIVGLTAGTAYTVTVVAHGADGDSAVSDASDSAMPLSPSTGNTISNANGTLQIFVRGTNDHLYTSIRATDGTWGTAVDLGYPIVSAPTVVRNANGKLEVFVVGYGHLVYHRQQVEPNSTTWSAWSVVGASVWTSNFVIEANADGSLQLFGRDAAGNVRTAKQTTAGGADWSELASLGGLVFSDPSVASSGGKLEVFAIGYDGLLWHRVQSAANASDWSAWARVGAGSLTSIL